MAREFLKDMFGRKIGSLEDQPKNQVAYDQNGAKVGRYEKNNNTTYDRDSKKVGTGNLLAGLFGKKK